MELIKIYEGNLIDARELHQFMEVKTPFNDWIRRMLEYGFEEGEEFYANLRKTSSKGGRPQKNFFLTLAAAKEIAMLQRTEKGKEARKYFIKCEQTLRELTKNKRFAAFSELETTKVKFKNKLMERGLSEEHYLEIDTAGKKILMNREEVEDANLSAILIKARDLATKMTDYHTHEKNLDSKEQIKASNEDNHAGLRETLLDKGIVPENLPKHDDVRKLKE